MRRSYDPVVELYNGQIAVIASGCDACTEHECGIKPLLEHFTDGAYAKDVAIAKKLGEIRSSPDIVESRRIKKNLDSIKLIEGKRITIGYGSEHCLTENNPELSPLRYTFNKDKNLSLTAAWDEYSFAFSAVDPKLKESLKRFYNKIQQGKIGFVGLFVENKQSLSGIILGDLDLISKQNVKKAQAEFDRTVLLHELSRVDELNDLLHKTSSGWSYIWPIWHKDTVVYAINPLYNTKANYYGPYTFDEMTNWLKTGCNYHLKPKACVTEP